MRCSGTPAASTAASTMPAARPTKGTVGSLAPFLWKAAPQPADRWQGDEDAPVTYLADSPDAAWAEFLCHEEIADPADCISTEAGDLGVSRPDPVTVGGRAVGRGGEPVLFRS